MITISSNQELPRKFFLRFSIWRWVLIGLLAYAFLYDNSTSLPTVKGYGWTRLLELPRQIRFVEIGVVGGVTLILLARPVSRLTRNLLTACLLVTFLTVISYLTIPIAPWLDVARLIYAYLLPALIFIIGRETRLDARARRNLFGFLLIWVFISAVVSWYQFAGLGYPVGDDITGINKDAHANGNLLIITGFILLGRSLWLRHRWEMGLALFFMLTMVLSSVLKSMFFSVLILGYIAYSFVVQSKSRRLGRIVWRLLVMAFLAVLVLGLVSTAFKDLDVRSSNRLGEAASRILSSPTKFGPLVAHVNAVKLVTSSFQSLLIGYGLYSYANPVTYGQTLEGGALAQYVREDLLALTTEHGEDTKVTLTSSWLVELGPPATLILLLIYGTILIRVWSCRQSDNPEDQAYAVGLVGCLLLLYLTASTSLFGSLEMISVSWPVMLLAGMTVRLEARRRKLRPAVSEITDEATNSMGTGI